MIPQIKKILYTTDLTKNSAYAAYFALDLAQKYDAKIVILHCANLIPDSVLYAPVGRHAAEVVEEMENDEKRRVEAEIKKRLDDFFQKVGNKIGPTCANLVSDIIIRPGWYPVEEILNTADAEQCDVIVLGTHGKGWLKQTFLGSTARSVLERSRRPVFVVPLPPEQTEIDWE